MLTLKFKKLHPKAIVPSYKTHGASGFDLHALVETDELTGFSYIEIPPKSQKLINTGLSCAVPEGMEMQIRPRSGLAAKNGITVTNSPGTVDADYRGPLMVILHNLGNETFVVNNGDRIAQGVICPVERVSIIETDHLDETERGEGGFGSTGIK